VFQFQSVWAPPAEEVVQLYEKLTTNPTISLVWKCPGRRSQLEEEQPAEVVEAPQTLKEYNLRFSLKTLLGL